MTNLQAIDLLKGLEQSLGDYCELNDEGKTAFGMAITTLELFGNSEQLPSAQPKERTEERMETHACDLIDRQAAINGMRFERGINDDGLLFVPFRDVEKHLKSLPPAQPELRYDEWCDTCKEYDHEKHCCTRFNRVIKSTVEELKSAQPEIIYCKDCIHSDIYPKGADYDMPLKCLGIRYGGVMPDWYCEHAERRA